jgi:hypothetical protein
MKSYPYHHLKQSLLTDVENVILGNSHTRFLNGGAASGSLPPEADPVTACTIYINYRARVFTPANPHGYTMSSARYPSEIWNPPHLYVTYSIFNFDTRSALKKIFFTTKLLLTLPDYSVNIITVPEKTS